MSKHSNKIDEFYATSQPTAEWLVDKLRATYDLEGKTAFEPAVGGFVFPNAAPELSWTTNDLNTWTDRKPDAISDFLESDFGHFDFVITNPPFGAGNKLAHNFLGKAAKHADVVAMVVPSSMGQLTSRIHKLMPKDFALMFCERCPDQWFDLPDGSHRPVRTHAVIWQKVVGYERPAPVKPIKDQRTPFFEFCDDGEYAVRVYGDGIGDLKPWEESCSGTWARFNIKRGMQIVTLKLIMSYPWRWKTGSCGGGRAPWDDTPAVVPSLSTAELLHWTNSIAVLEGRIPPLEGVDYEEVLTQTQERLLIGLQLPADTAPREGRQYGRRKKS